LDTDPVAVEVARQNAALNRVEAIVDVEQGTIGDYSSPEVRVYRATDYDLLLVNIFAEVIISMAPAIVEALRSGGLFVASGLISDKAGAVADALGSAGLHLDERYDENGWVALVGHKA